MNSMPRLMSDDWIMAKIPGLDPEMAKSIIEKAEALELRWSQDVMSALLKKSGERPPEPAAPEEQSEQQAPPQPPEGDFPF